MAQNPQNKNRNKQKSSVSYALLVTLLVISLVTILGMASFASAFENYQLTAPFSPVTVASCSAQTEVLLLKNTGSEAAQVSLSFVDSKVAQFAQIEPSSVFMAPGDSQTITLFINAPCSTQGTFDYSIKLQSNSQAQIFDRQLIVSKINNIDFIATQGNVLQSCPCVPQTIPFTITNTGAWPESYTVKAIGGIGDSAQENVAVPDGQLFLAPGQTFSGAAFASYSCQTYGTKNFALQVTAKNSGSQATMPIQYNIAACYDYSLGTQPTTSICEQDTQEIAAVVNNSAAYTNTFNIGSSLPSFASLNGNQLTLLPGQIGIAPIELAPQIGDAGNYSYTIKTTSVLGNFFAQTSGTIDVQRCYDYSIVPIGQTSQNPQGGSDAINSNAQNQNTANSATSTAKFDVCAPGESATLTITNNGERTQEMHINSTDARFSAQPDIFNLTTGASKDIALTIPSVGIEQKMSFYLDVWSSANPGAVTAKEITLQPYDLKTCYGVEVSPVVFTLNNSLTNLAVQIKNTGIRGAAYTLALSGPQWTNLTNSSVFIPASQTATVGIHAAAPLYVENTTYIGNLTIRTPYSQQIVPVRFILNPSAAQWLLWILAVALLLLIALLIILLAARASRKKRIDQSMSEEEKLARQKEAARAQALAVQQAARQTAATARRDAAKIAQAEFAQKLAEQEERKRARKEDRKSRSKKDTNQQSHSNWLHLLFIILIVAILLALLMTLVIRNSTINTFPSNTSLTTNVSNSTSPANISIVQNTSASNQTNATEIVTNTTATNAANTTNSGAVNSTNTTQPQSISAWQSFVNFLWNNFNIFDVQENTTNTTPNTVSNTTQNATTQNTTIQNTTTVTTPTASQNQTQRDIELAAANEFLAENPQSTHIFILAENQTGILNLSHYFIDPDNLTLQFQFTSVNASKTTAFITSGLLLLEPQKSFVGMQTFRITATNEANLSTTSPLFTLVVLDALPTQPISQSVQIGLLALLIIIAVIVYFDIRLISRQYEYARTMQQDKDDKQGEKNGKAKDTQSGKKRK